MPIIEACLQTVMKINNRNPEDKSVLFTSIEITNIKFVIKYNASYVKSISVSEVYIIYLY